MVFHEITEPAIREPPRIPGSGHRPGRRPETRRILDRLYGYEISPVLEEDRSEAVRWTGAVGRDPSSCSANVSMAFRSASYWDILAGWTQCRPQRHPPRFNARLVAVDGKRVATGRDFDSPGGRSASRTRCWSSMRRRPEPWRTVYRARRWPSRQWRRSLTPVGLPAVRDLDAAAGRRAANCDSVQSAR